MRPSGSHRAGELICTGGRVLGQILDPGYALARRAERTPGVSRRRGDRSDAGVVVRRVGGAHRRQFGPTDRIVVPLHRSSLSGVWIRSAGKLELICLTTARSRTEAVAGAGTPGGTAPA